MISIGQQIEAVHDEIHRRELELSRVSGRMRETAMYKIARLQAAMTTLEAVQRSDRTDQPAPEAIA